ncbi:MAG: MurR/RpiR family transcriptional regulator, partial [Planctomycetota bacterium]
AANQRLTPTERRIAEEVIKEPTLLAFGTVSDLAERVGTSRPSIVRFANKLGFDGYTDLQTQVRSGLSQQLSRPSDRIRNAPEPAREGARVAMQEALEIALAATAGEALVQLTRPLVTAENVWILSGETSRAGAHALQSGLTMVRPDVHLIDEHSGGRALSGAGRKDAAVVIDFARYRQHAVTTARALATRDVQIVAITDGPFSPLASLTTNWCELKIPAIGPFDSSLPVVAVAELMVAEAAGQLRAQARRRIDETERLWEDMGTFLPDN